MTVKELITRLLDEDMNSNVLIRTPYKEVREDGVKGALFNIDTLESGTTNNVYIQFTDWRK